MPTPFMATRCGRRAMSDTSGCMKKYATKRSRMVEIPRNEREAPHRADGEDVEHGRADQRHEVGGEDGAERAGERPVDARADASRPPRTSSFMRS